MLSKSIKVGGTFINIQVDKRINLLTDFSGTGKSYIGKLLGRLNSKFYRYVNYTNYIDLDIYLNNYNEDGILFYLDNADLYIDGYIDKIKNHKATFIIITKNMIYNYKFGRDVCNVKLLNDGNSYYMGK